MIADSAIADNGDAELVCDVCDKRRRTKLTPRGKPRIVPPWKEIHGRTLCPVCKTAAYVLRAVTFPLAGIWDDGSERGWPDLRTALAAAWGRSTSLANWGIRELLAADFRRMPSMTQCPPMPDLRRLWGPSGLYSHAVAHYPDWREVWAGASGAASVLLRQVESRYRGTGRQSQRFRILWLGDQRAATYRYPYPYPVRNPDWTARWSDDGQRCPLVTLPLGGDRWTLRLRGGDTMRRQLAAFGQIVSGEAEQGELSLYRVTRHMGGEGSAGSDREPGGGGRFATEIMVKLVAWLPRRVPGVRERTLKLRTGGNAFWTAALPSRDPWVLHADHVRRWSAEHVRRRQRLADDLKAEKRLPARRRRQLQDRLEEFCRVRNGRVTSFIKEVCAQLAGFAQRQRVGLVEYDDTDRSYLSEFPWAALKARLKVVLDERGIALSASDEEEETP